MAGIAAGESATLQGVAPGASLIAIQIGSEVSRRGCGTAGSPCVVLFDSDVLAALDYVADTLVGRVHDRRRQHELRLRPRRGAASPPATPRTRATSSAIDALRALGIASVAAAGNGSVTTGISAPACISSAIGVGASTDTSATPSG